MNRNIEYLEKGDFEDASKRGWHGSGWYFWDEADGQYCYGPYASYSEAEDQLEEYCQTL